MEPSTLALYTSQELIEELMRRTTFFGVVVHAETDHKTQRWHGERMFKAHFNSNLNPAEAARLLDTVADYVERTHE